MRKVLLWAVGLPVALLLVAGLTIWATVRMMTPAAPAPAAPTEFKGVVVPMDEIVTNLADPGAHVKVRFALVVAGEKEKELLAPRLALVRAGLVSELRQQKAADLHGSDGAVRLAAVARDRVNAEAGSDLVQQVVVTDLVTQP